MINYLLISKNGDEEWEEGCFESLEALREAAKEKMEFLYGQDDFWGEKVEDGKLLEKIEKETFDEENYVEKSYFGKANTSLAEQVEPENKEPDRVPADEIETFDALSDPVLLKAAEETEEILSGPLVQKKKKAEQSEISMLLTALTADGGSKGKVNSEKIIELKTLMKLLINAVQEAKFSSGGESVMVLTKQCFDIVEELTKEEGASITHGLKTDGLATTQ